LQEGIAIGDGSNGGTHTGSPRRFGAGRLSMRRLRGLIGRIRLRRDSRLLASSGLFDSGWYLTTYPDVAAAAVNPLLHFLLNGAADGRDPNPLFDTSWYLAVNPDVAAAQINPLVHFIRAGAAEGRDPNPFFDAKWYLASNPDIAATGDNALAHFIRSGAAEGRSPGPVFDTRWYRATYPDVAATGINPLAHYLRFGATEGRLPNPFFDAQAATPSARIQAMLAAGDGSGNSQLDEPIERIRRAAMFDDAFYRERNSERLGGASPLKHFLLIGEAEGAQPYANYSPGKVRATLRARGVPMLGTPFLRFVQSQLDAFREQVARNRALDQPTWVSPVGMMFLLGGEGTPLDMGAPPSERPALRFRIDQKSGADFVIPIVSPGHSIQGLRVSVEGSATEVPVSLAISRNLTEPPLATRTGRFQSKSSAVEWDLGGIPFESGRRYFLQISAAQPTGLEIAARAFHPADMVTRVQDDVAHAAIVTIVYRDAEHIEAFLEAIYRQTYAGPVTVVIVDDCSPADAFAKFERRVERMRAGTPPNVAIRIIRNPENVGNCLSRNAGIAACAADIYIVIDSDCLINRDFIRAHIAEHRLPDTDAVVGPYNIETYGEDGLALVKRLERERNQILPRSTMQDEQLENAFVNTVTRNFSIKKRWLDKHGVFDPMLSYSRKPESGYGWEDVDIGARIYAAKGTIRYTSHAFSIHLTHESSTAAADKVKGSAENFRYLVNKHPFIRTAARRWYVDTADRIVSWADEIGETSPALESLRNDIREPKRAIAPLIPYLRKQKRRYRILTHRWHVPHQREIYKLPFDFTLLTGTGTGFTNDWGYDQRPLRPNVRLVPAESVDPSAFDMAIVHFDENVLCPDLSNGVLGAEWGDTFRWFMENIKLPMVAVCHGTVPFVGQYAANPDAIPRFEVYQSEADELRRTLAQVNVVVNSHQAADEWRFHRSRVIWHGLDPQEFTDGTHELDVVHHGVDAHRPHYRGAHALREALDILEAGGLKISSHKHVSTAPVPRSDPRFSDFAFRNWLDHLGRHKVYLNTTLRSPMPRSRTEAMLRGVIPVSLDNHDVSRFIRNGVNGFYSSSAGELAEFCKTVCRDPGMRERMSIAARQTAMDVFNHDRFMTEWVKLIEETLGDR